jgi:hypothetical protein
MWRLRRPPRFRLRFRGFAPGLERPETISIILPFLSEGPAAVMACLVAQQVGFAGTP